MRWGWRGLLMGNVLMLDVYVRLMDEQWIEIPRLW